jgi:hypothetical protein
MSEVKVSQLPVATDTTETDTFCVVQGGVSKRITLGTILQKLKSASDIIFDVGATSTINFIIKKGATEVFRVYGSNSNVGIKTVSPASDLHLTGNFKIGAIGVADDTDGIPAVSGTGIIIGSSEIIGHPLAAPASISPSVTHPIEISKGTTLIKAYGASKYRLDAGINGQTKTIILLAQDQTITDSAEVTVTNGLGLTKFTLNSLGDAVTLTYISNKWVVMSNSGAIIV